MRVSKCGKAYDRMPPLSKPNKGKAMETESRVNENT